MDFSASDRPVCRRRTNTRILPAVTDGNTSMMMTLDDDDARSRASECMRVYGVREVYECSNVLRMRSDDTFGAIFREYSGSDMHGANVGDTGGVPRTNAVKRSAKSWHCVRVWDEIQHLPILCY